MLCVLSILLRDFSSITRALEQTLASLDDFKHFIREPLDEFTRERAALIHRKWRWVRRWIEYLIDIRRGLQPLRRTRRGLDPIVILPSSFVLRYGAVGRLVPSRLDAKRLGENQPV